MADFLWALDPGFNKICMGLQIVPIYWISNMEISHTTRASVKFAEFLYMFGLCLCSKKPIHFAEE